MNITWFAWKCTISRGSKNRMNSRMSIFNKLNVHGRHKLKDERNRKWMRDNHTNCWPHTSWLQALLGTLFQPPWICSLLRGPTYIHFCRNFQSFCVIHFAIAIITDANDAVMKHVLKQWLCNSQMLQSWNMLEQWLCNKVVWFIFMNLMMRPRISIFCSQTKMFL